jgi:hypothetical protein
MQWWIDGLQSGAIALLVGGQRHSGQGQADGEL